MFIWREFYERLCVMVFRGLRKWLRARKDLVTNVVG